MQKLIIICGPTATGKSALAVTIAQQFSGEILSADSRQIYTGLDIGSAKITPAEMQDISHYGLDITHPNDYFSVANFQNYGREVVSKIIQTGKLPIICGGTGMYIDAVVYDTQFPEVPPNPEFRREVESLSAEELFKQLSEIDPDRASEIDPRNKVRIIRALEIAHAIGKVPKFPVVIPASEPESRIQPQNTWILNQVQDDNTKYKILWIGLDIPKEILQERIKDRINARTPALFDEIKNLHASGVTFERLESFGLEYRYGSQYVQGKITIDEFRELLATKTWQYAKRQMTWFGRNPEINWFNPLTDQQKILKLVQDFINT